MLKTILNFKVYPKHLLILLQVKNDMLKFLILKNDIARGLTYTFLGGQNLATTSQMAMVIKARKICLPNIRLIGTSCTTLQKHLIINVDSKSGIAEVKMNKPPVNSLNLELCNELTTTIKSLEKSCRGLILTSNLPNIFSAGLDLNEIYPANINRITRFVYSFQQLWIDIYGTKLATVAAINGHSPGGGCVLTLSCDYRIMTRGKYSIGLNETLVGIVAPPWVREVMMNTIGYRKAEYAIELGTMYSPEEASKIKLVDELVASPEETVTKAKDELVLKWLGIPSVARQLTKQSLRRETIEKLEKARELDSKTFVELTTADTTQQELGLYLQNLKKKK